MAHHASSICEPCERSGQSRQALLVINGDPVCRRCARGSTVSFRERYLREVHTEDASPLVPEPKLARRPVEPLRAAAPDLGIVRPPVVRVRVRAAKPVRVPTAQDHSSREIVGTSYRRPSELVQKVCALIRDARERSVRRSTLGRERSLRSHVAHYVLNERFHLSYAQIGRLMGCHHTTVLYGSLRVRELLKDDAEVRQLVQDVVREVSA